MSWEIYTRSAEDVLNSSRIPSSLEIISLIKKVNPTKLYLSEPDRERGYELKGKLQNLLLEHYGECFYLAAHPYNPDIILIKHQVLPSIDACHADLESLSLKALDTVAEPASRPPGNTASRQTRKVVPKQAAPACSVKEALRRAQRRLEEYAYPEAEQVLAGIRISEIEELPALVKAARMLMDEMGAFDRAIETLLSQPKHVIKDKSIRELLALAYYRNGMTPEARAIFDSTYPADLGKDALYAYADISFKDGNLSHAFHLLKVAEEREGFISAGSSLRKEIEAGMLAEAEPVLQRAIAAFEREEFAQAGVLAHEALHLYPNFPAAREIVARIEAMKTDAEITGLWAALERSTKSCEKIDLLSRLLERDKGSREKIKNLISLEKARQKRDLSDSRIRTLGTLVEQGNWPECYDILMSLSQQEDDPESYHAAISISPFFSVLYQNKRMQRLVHQTAKELWLDFVKVKLSLQSGDDEECFETLQKLKPYLQSYEQFSEDYGRLLAAEQEKARREIHNLLAKAEAAGCTLADVTVLFGSLRRRMAILPADERAGYSRSMEDRIHQLKPCKAEDVHVLLDAYREALLLGNEAKALLLREVISDKEALVGIDGEIESMFAIHCEPVTVSIQENMHVDLNKETAPLCRMGSTYRHIMLREDDETVLLIDLEDMSANRFRSPSFEDLVVCDAIPERHVFLFRNGELGNTVWRAVLSGSDHRFTAVFDIPDKLCQDENQEVEAVFMSSGRTTEYYCCLQDREHKNSPSVEKRLLNSKSPIQKYEPRNQLDWLVKRASSEPDRFLVGFEADMRIFNKNLSSPYKLPIPTRIYGIDQREGRIYLVHGPFLLVSDLKLCRVTGYPNSGTSAFFCHVDILGICPTTETVLLTLHKGRGIFYDLSNNKFSTLFNVDSVICSEVPSTWYYMEYAEGSSRICLKDITPEINDHLEWHEIFSPEIGAEAGAANLRKLRDGEDIVRSLRSAPLNISS